MRDRETETERQRETGRQTDRQRQRKMALQVYFPGCYTSKNVA